MSIEMTPKAKEELARLGVGPSNFLRISVVQGGCAGMTYNAGIDTRLGEGDEIVHQDPDGFRIVADAGSALYLDGLSIDYSDDLVQSGFRFNNPAAAHACGCGSSFRAAG